MVKYEMIDNYKGEKTPMSNAFLLPSDVRHIDRWRYSPEGSVKQVETFF